MSTVLSCQLHTTLTSLEKASRNKLIYVQCGDVFIKVDKCQMMTAARLCTKFSTFETEQHPNVLYVTGLFKNEAR